MQAFLGGLTPNPPPPLATNMAIRIHVISLVLCTPFSFVAITIIVSQGPFGLTLSVRSKQPGVVYVDQPAACWQDQQLNQPNGRQADDLPPQLVDWYKLPIRLAWRKPCATPRLLERCCKDSHAWRRDVQSDMVMIDGAADTGFVRAHLSTADACT